MKMGSTELRKGAAAVERLVAAGDLAGAVMAAWQSGSLVGVETIGHRDLATSDPMRRDAIFQIASTTKVVVSVAALQLLDEGKLALDDPVTRWIPELAGRRVLARPDAPLDETVPADRDITVHDLLTHRSGIPYFTGAQEPLATAMSEALGPTLGSPLPPDEWLAALGALPQPLQPGDRFQYGHAMDILGFLLARVDDKTLGEVLQDRIFDPLGMPDTGFWVPAEKHHRLARMYRRTAEGLTDVTVPYATPPVNESGGGGLYSTADDFGRFIGMLAGGGQLDGVRILAEATVADMTRDHLTPRQHELGAFGIPEFFEGQGFGLSVAVLQDPARVGRFGAGGVGSISWPGGFGTWWQYDPANELALALFTQELSDSSAPNSRPSILAFRDTVYGSAGR